VKNGSTYDVIRNAIERDLVRNLGNREFPRGLRAVRSPTLPMQDDLAVVDGDQPAGCATVSRIVSALHLDENACHRGVGEKAAERLLAHTLTFSARARRHRPPQRRARPQRWYRPSLRLE
jgi:hypothetical protein